MCNLYFLTKGQQAIRELAGAMSDRTGNLPLLPGIYPDYRARCLQPNGRPRTIHGAVGHARRERKVINHCRNAVAPIHVSLSRHEGIRDFPRKTAWGYRM
jgi:hypothetical protein